MTLVGWGTQVHVLLEVAEIIAKDKGIEAEVIDLQSILPWDADTVVKVCTGRMQGLKLWHCWGLCAWTCTICRRSRG